MEYITISTIWHSKEGRMIGRGEIVKLDHLNQPQIDAVVQAGGIAPLEGVASLLAIPGIAREQMLLLVKTLGVHTAAALAEQPVAEIVRALGVSPDEAAAIRRAAGTPTPAPSTTAESEEEAPRPTRRPRVPTE